MSPGNTDRPLDSAGRSAARLAAVQALYQMELTALDAEAVIAEFVEHRFARDTEFAPAAEPDAAFFGDIVRGVPHRQTEIDRAIAQCLSADWKLTRIDSILRAILRASAYELISRADVPAKVVIDQYVEIAHAFFEGDEPGFVNAALDKMARKKRGGELEGKARDAG